MFVLIDVFTRVTSRCRNHRRKKVEWTQKKMNEKTMLAALKGTEKDFCLQKDITMMEKMMNNLGDKQVQKKI